MSLSTSESGHLFTFLSLLIPLAIFLLGSWFPCQFVRALCIIHVGTSAAICAADITSQLCCLLSLFMVRVAM